MIGSKQKDRHWTAAGRKTAAGRATGFGTHEKAMTPLGIMAYTEPGMAGLSKRVRRRPTFPRVNAVSSARRVLTSLFGMGRGAHPRSGRHGRYASPQGTRVGLPHGAAFSLPHGAAMVSDRWGGTAHGTHGRRACPAPVGAGLLGKLSGH